MNLFVREFLGPRDISLPGLGQGQSIINLVLIHPHGLDSFPIGIATWMES